MAKPTIVLIPGSWHTPEIHSSTIQNLSIHGYSAIAIPLPSVGADPSLPNFDSDVQAIRSKLVKLIEEEGKDVVLVTHSYSGMPGGEAAAGMGKAERLEMGLEGGIARLVYIMALAFGEGFQPTAGGPFPEWMRLDEEKRWFTVTQEDAKKIFYNDLLPEEANRWASKLSTESAGVYESVTTCAPWRHIPSTFVIGSKDKSSIMPEIVEYMIGSARQQIPAAFDVVERCEGGGHCLMISHPDWLADVLRRAGGEVV